MMVEKNKSENFSRKDIELLAISLKILIPPSPERGLPSPNLTRLIEFIDKNRHVQKTRFFLNTISEYAMREFQVPFCQLDEIQKVNIMQMFQAKQFRSWIDFFSLVATVYYQDRSVLQALGLNPTLFPEGYRLQNSDLELLESVYERGKIFRDLKF